MVKYYYFANKTCGVEVQHRALEFEAICFEIYTIDNILVYVTDMFFIFCFFANVYADI